MEKKGKLFKLNGRGKSKHLELSWEWKKLLLFSDVYRLSFTEQIFRILNVSSQKFGLRFKQLAEFLKPHVETRSSVGYFKCSRVIFFDLSFLSQTSRIHRTTREVGGNFLNSSIPLLTSSKTLTGKLLQIAHLCT